MYIAVFNRFERVCCDVRWDNVILIVDRVYGPMNSLFNNRYVQFFFLVVRKHLSTRINRISFTILSDEERKLNYIRTRGFLLSRAKCNLSFVKKKDLRSFSLL